MCLVRKRNVTSADEVVSKKQLHPSYVSVLFLTRCIKSAAAVPYFQIIT